MCARNKNRVFLLKTSQSLRGQYPQMEGSKCVCSLTKIQRPAVKILLN